MNADAMTDEQYRIYKFSNCFDLKNLPNNEFERSKRFEDSNIFNCSSVIASAFICHFGASPGEDLPKWIAKRVVVLKSLFQRKHHQRTPEVGVVGQGVRQTNCAKPLRPLGEAFRKPDGCPASDAGAHST